MQQLAALTVLLLVPCCLAQVPGWGSCPDVKVKQDFEISKYLGKWYEIQKLPVVYERKAPRCIRAIYSLKEDGHIKVDNKGVDKYNNSDAIIGDAYCPDPRYPGKLAVRFYEWTPYGDYWVLDTDYNTFSLVFSCSQLGAFHFQSCWILSRKRKLSKDIVEKLRTEAKGYGIKVDKFTVTEQTNCPDT